MREPSGWNLHYLAAKAGRAHPGTEGEPLRPRLSNDLGTHHRHEVRDTPCRA